VLAAATIVISVVPLAVAVIVPALANPDPAVMTSIYSIATTFVLDTETAVVPVRVMV
jgi:hypothetical protein